MEKDDGFGKYHSTGEETKHVYTRLLTLLFLVQINDYTVFILAEKTKAGNRKSVL